MELKGKKINFLGDSITEGVGTSGPAARFSDRIAAHEGAICRNYGIGGTRLARQYHPSENPRWDLDFPSRVAEMDPDADVVVVFGGTNDFGHGDAPFGHPTDRTVDTFCGALHVLYRSLIEKYPEAVIVVATPLHRRIEDFPFGERAPQLTEKMMALAEQGTPDWRDAAVAPLKAYVDQIRETAEYYSLPVLDLYACSGMQPAVPVIKERYMPDGLHPNDAGHCILERLIVSCLKAL